MNRTLTFNRLSRWSSVLVLALCLTGAPLLHAQDSGDTSGDDSFLKRFSFGGRISMLFNNLMNEESLTSSTAEPPFKATIATASSSSRLGGGATVEFAVLDHLSISADFLYRRAGYKTASTVIEGLDDPDTDDEDERLITTTFEGTTANYWDVPVVARLYNGSRHERRLRAFLDVGVALRHVSNIRSFREYLNADDTNEVDLIAATPANQNLPGAVLGGGFQIPAAQGLKISPQVRYTRWLGRTFDSPPTASMRNQVEFLVGFTF